MKLKFNWGYTEDEFDTKTVQLIDFPARESRHEKNAEIAIIKDDLDFTFAEIKLRYLKSSNAFAKELVRRWNEFPEELKQ